ncbi:hypothetical protein [Chondromyces apiculatus]|uniref:Uncharacterized protein n=1 Tax=Chondromyces apiculatus DSM 436 TaxID=1192034 RepID=A0A017TG57_9BACT|nr:hypothetical protein [Chondromyces apiculatus]EYF07907.1 Hypothetical protein CAP_6929 [Chondromyces apiculatus DSM 436]
MTKLYITLLRSSVLAAALLAGLTGCGNTVLQTDPVDGDEKAEPDPPPEPDVEPDPPPEPDTPPPSGETSPRSAPSDGDEPPAASAPGVNAMDCSKQADLNLPEGALACYGVWDYGDAFGNDIDMCGDYLAPETGCAVATPACASGLAKSSRVVSISSASSEEIATIAQNLDVTPAVVREEMVEVYVYNCTSF